MRIRSILFGATLVVATAFVPAADALVSCCPNADKRENSVRIAKQARMFLCISLLFKRAGFGAYKKVKPASSTLRKARRVCRPWMFDRLEDDPGSAFIEECAER